MKHSISAALLSSLVLFGCNEGKEANEKNFTKAVSDYLQNEPGLCINIASQGGGFPITVTKLDLRAQATSPTGIANEMTALENAGLATGRDVDDVPNLNHMEKGKRYELTEEGKKYYKVGNAEFCYGKKVLAHITHWEVLEPVNDPDKATVEYTYTLENVPAWTTTPAIQTAFPSIRNNSYQGSRALKLRDEGWQVVEGGFR